GHQADQYPNACHVLTLTLDTQGHLLTTELRFRAWSPRGGHWHDDDSLYRDSQQGRLTWYMRSPVLLRPAANPYDPWTPATPAQFVGRQRLFQWLEAALEEGRSVSIVGDWRMGKSSVLEIWGQRAHARGRVVKSVTGEGPEGISPGAFVKAITG